MLELGDRVRHISRPVTGVVVPNGPYGDQPFQVRLEDGSFGDSLWPDGTTADGLGGVKWLLAIEGD